MTTLYAQISNTEKDPKNNESKLWEYLINSGQYLPAPYNSAFIFYKNKKDMDKADVKKSDKYFHSKANMQSIQRGGLYNLLPATTFSIGKEVWDTINKNALNPNGQTMSENLKDSLEDLGADFYGMGQGFLHPKGNPQVYLEKYRVNGLDDSY